MANSQVIANAVALMNPVLREHPGAVVRTSFYASSAGSEIQAAKANNFNGKLRVPANNLVLGSSTTFQVFSPDLVYGAELHAKLTPGANNGPQCEGWLFQAIDTIKVWFTSGGLPQVTLPGYLMREYILTCCDTPEQRQILLRNAGQVGTVATQVAASIPIGWILGSGLGVQKGFPIDMSYFKGPLQIEIKFNTSNFFITGTGTGAAAPINTVLVSQFDSLFMTFSTTEVLTKELSAVSQWMARPTEGHYIPGEYLSYQHLPVTATIGVQTDVALTSIQNGMLEAIILVIKPSAEFFSASAAPATSVFPGSVNLSSLVIKNGGTVMFQADTEDEIKQYYRTHFNGDDKTYSYKYLGPNVSATGVVAGSGAYIVSRDSIYRAIMHNSCYLIPLCYDGCKSLSGNMTENLPSYGGSTLTLSFVPARRSRESMPAGFGEFALDDTVGGGVGAQAYYVDVLYVISSIFGGQPSAPSLVFNVPNY